MGPINSVLSVRLSVRPFLRAERSFLRIRSLLFSEILAQVRVPEMGETLHLVILGGVFLFLIRKFEITFD